MKEKLICWTRSSVPSIKETSAPPSTSWKREEMVNEQIIYLASVQCSGQQWHWFPLQVFPISQVIFVYISFIRWCCLEVWLVNVSFSMFMFLLVQFVHLTLVVWLRNWNIPKRVNKKHKSKWWIFVKLNLQNENTEKEKRWEDLIRIWFHFVHWLI